MMLVTMMAGWINRQQQDAIAYSKYVSLGTLISKKRNGSILIKQANL